MVKRIVVVSTIFPLPVDDGKKAVLAGFLEYMVERYGAKQVTYIMITRSKNKVFWEVSMPCECITLERPNTLRRLWNILRFVLVRREKSIQELMLYSPKLRYALHSVIADIDPDLIVCDTFRIGQFFETSERPESTYILYMDDLFSVRYQRILEVLTWLPNAELNLLGNFAQFVPIPLRFLVAGSALVHNPLLRLEQRLVERREQECANWFETCLLINKEEASLLQKRTGHP